MSRKLYPLWMRFLISPKISPILYDSVRASRLGLEAVEEGKEPGVDELDEVVASEGGVVVDLAVLFRRRP